MAEQEVAELIDDLGVKLLRDTISKATQKRLYSAVFRHSGRVEEGIAERQNTCLNAVSVFLQPCCRRRDETMAKAIGRRGKFGGDAGIDAGIIPIIGRNGVLADQQGKIFIIGNRLDFRFDPDARRIE